MKCFNWLYAYQTKARNPGNTIAATNPVLEILIISIDLFKDLQIRNVWPSNDLYYPLMTSNDFQNEFFLIWLYAYQKKARNPGKTVAATNSVFDLLMTSNDLK